MKDKQNEFYTSISKYYHEIFPFNQGQLNFVRRNKGELSGNKILDVGCATGELAFQLADAGALVTGIDMNDDLLEQGRKAKNHPNLSFKKADMLEIERIFSPRQFDAVICFGNTLVHLPSLPLIKKMLKGVALVLKPGAAFFLQILNYDYILSEPVTELPVIDTDNIRFVRRYIIEENNPLIGFSTQLYLKNEDELIENETLLYALESKELVRLMEDAGFVEVKMFSNFKEEEFGGKHLPLVVKTNVKG